MKNDEKETGYLSKMRPPKMLKLYEALDTILIQKDRSFHGLSETNAVFLNQLAFWAY